MFEILNRLYGVGTDWSQGFSRAQELPGLSGHASAAAGSGWGGQECLEGRGSVRLAVAGK